MRSRAEKTANGWRLNGSKLWTTYGHKAHYMIALVRTSGTPEDRNAGLSQLLIDLSTPGVKASPIHDLTGGWTAPILVVLAMIAPFVWAALGACRPVLVGQRSAVAVVAD